MPCCQQADVCSLPWLPLSWKFAISSFYTRFGDTTASNQKYALRTRNFILQTKSLGGCAASQLAKKALVVVVDDEVSDLVAVLRVAGPLLQPEAQCNDCLIPARRRIVWSGPDPLELLMDRPQAELDLAFHDILAHIFMELSDKSQCTLILRVDNLRLYQHSAWVCIGG